MRANVRLSVFRQWYIFKYLVVLFETCRCRCIRLCVRIHVNAVWWADGSGLGVLAKDRYTPARRRRRTLLSILILIRPILFYFIFIAFPIVNACLVFGFRWISRNVSPWTIRNIFNCIIIINYKFVSYLTVVFLP